MPPSSPSPRLPGRYRRLRRSGWSRWSWPRRGWRRTVALRRLAAGLLAVAAGVLAVGPQDEPGRGAVVVAARDLAAGAAMTPTDVALHAWPEETVPAGALTDPRGAVGRVPVGGVRAGEALTDVRLLGTEAAVSATGRPDAAGVPLRLADPGLTALLRAGMRVDVVAVPDAAALTPSTASRSVGAGGATGPRADGTRTESTRTESSRTGGSGVVAGSAVVLAVLPPPERSTAGPVVVVALPAEDAARVAATALSREVTVTLR